MEWRKKNRAGKVVVWCRTQQEVEDFFDIAESEGVKWVSGSGYPNLRDNTGARNPYTEYYICPNNELMYNPRVKNSNNATVLGSDLHNYAISVRNKRS